MKVFAVTLALLLMAPIGLRAQTAPESIAGVWESDEKDVRMEYFQDGDHYSAKLLWGNRIVEVDGVTSELDAKNPDPGLRSREIIGIVSLTGLKWNGEKFTGGRIYDPPSGKTYKCKVWLEGDKLYLRGYLGVSVLGKTVAWHRYQTRDAKSAGTTVN